MSEVLAKLESIEGHIATLRGELNRLSGKVDVLQSMVSGESSEQSATKRNAAIGALVVKIVGGGGLAAALAGIGGNYLHEQQKTSIEAQQFNQMQDMEVLKQELIAQQKKELDEARRKIEESIADRESRDSASARDSRLLRPGTRRSARQ
jgi:uncharacterized protein HemX